MATGDRRYAWYVVGVLSVINFMNYADRQVMFALYPHVQDDLGFSDFHLGLLGAAFLVVLSVASIPGGLLADRWLRRKVIAIGVGLWSVAAALGGIARGFADLFAFRALAGVGEAAYYPAANAMISDYFPPQGRGRAMGVFSAGMVLGGGGGMIAATAIADYHGWRYAFLAAGLPGLVLAALAFRLREPRIARPAEKRPPAMAGLCRLLGTPTVRYNVLGGICVTFCIGGLIAWTVTFLDRYFVRPSESAQTSAVLGSAAASLPAPWAPALAPLVATAQASAAAAVAVHHAETPRAERAAKGELARLSGLFGIVALLAGVLGALSGGALADRLMRRRRSGKLLVAAAGYLLGAPFVLAGLWAAEVSAFLVCLFAAMFFFTWYMGPSIAILHDVVPYRYRATVAAGYILSVHLFGDAISPPLIGLLSQAWELRLALLLPLAMAVLGALFFLFGMRTVHEDMERALREGAGDTVGV